MSEHRDCDHCGACIKDDPTEACCHEIQVGGGDFDGKGEQYFFDLCPKCSKKFFEMIEKFVPHWRD